MSLSRKTGFKLNRKWHEFTFVYGIETRLINALNSMIKVLTDAQAKKLGECLIWLHCPDDIYRENESIKNVVDLKLLDYASEEVAKWLDKSNVVNKIKKFVRLYEVVAFYKTRAEELKRFDICLKIKTENLPFMELVLRRHIKEMDADQVINILTSLGKTKFSSPDSKFVILNLLNKKIDGLKISDAEKKMEIQDLWNIVRKPQLNQSALLMCRGNNFLWKIKPIENKTNQNMQSSQLNRPGK